jgi:cellulose synthase (UDP-forming)
MPNLELCANAGFPFTQLADLAETTVVLPAVPAWKRLLFISI